MAAAPVTTIFGVAPALLAQGLSAIAIFALMLAVYAAVTSRNPMAARLKSLEDRRRMLATGPNRQPSRHANRGDKKERAKTNSARRSQIRLVMDRLKLLQDTQVKAVELTLSRAGFRSRDLAVLIILARLILPVAVGILAIVMMFGLDYGANMSPLKRFLMPTAILYVAYLLPDLIIDRMAKTRIEAIRLAFPDTLDLMVICAEAGLTIDASLQRVSRELAGPFPEMADELSLTAIELNFMSDRRTAFQNFAARVPLDTANAVATTLIQTEKYGTPLASALRVLSVEFRHTRMMQAEAKAARLPVLMTIPMMVFLVPPIFVVLVAPAACSMMEHGL